MKFVKVVAKPHDCQGKIQSFLWDCEEDADESYMAPWVGSVIECDCGKTYRLEDSQREGVDWVLYTPAPLASPGRTRL